MTGPKGRGVEPKARGAAWTEERGTSDEGRGRSEGGMGRWVGPRRRARKQSRTIGAAAGSTLALALLVCGCVFAAMAGPALSLHTRTQALHQTLAGLAGTTKTVQVTANWSSFTSSMAGSGGSSQDLTPGLLAASTGEIGRGLAATPLPLAPGDWAGLSTNLLGVSSGAAPSAQAGAPPRLEVVYRDRLTSNAQLTAGRYASGKIPAGALGVAATPQTAARFGLHPGSRLVLTTVSGPVALFVTAIVRERDPDSTFWTQDPIVGTPSLNIPPPNQGLPYWAGGVFTSLASSPLQHGAVLVVVLTIATAAAFGLFIVILGLALGSAERVMTLARLTVMGHESPTRLVMAEALPAVLAAIVAGAVCAVALPHVVGSSVDLSAFTGTSAPVQFRPNVVAFGLPAVAILVLALAALIVETRTLRRRGITGMLRTN